MGDSFVYENCSKSISTDVEFCTGAPIVSSYGQEWLLKDNEFVFSKQYLRGLRKDVKWNGDGTIHRAGAKYINAQHTNAVGDACYGDAGGSVWKFLSYRGQQSNSTKRPHRVAVLTGVISRFEEYCGVFRPDKREHFSRPVQHTIHARVRKMLPWILGKITSDNGDGNCEG